jgi:hypothetical protein
LQEGRTEPVALILERDPEIEELLGEAGIRFFTSVESLRHYVEQLLSVDLDGDGIIGPPEAGEVGMQGEPPAPPNTATTDDDAQLTEAEFHREMLRIYERARAEAGYNATYFIQMVAGQGGLTTARKLVTATTPSQGFTHLWERGRLDLTVEALVVDPRCSTLFTASEIGAAQRRLSDFAGPAR